MMASNKSKSGSDIRILLIGRTGHGKSSTGNTITGRTVFGVSDAATSETKTCEWSDICKRLGRTVEVVDTPGIFDTDQSIYTVQKEMIKATALTTPGFHAIAFVLMRGRFTEELQKTQDIFFDWFGQGVEKFAFVILTNTDNNDVRDDFLNNKPHPKLTEMIQKCNRRVVALNNNSSDVQKIAQVEDIFKVIEKIKRCNGNKSFTNVAYKLAEAYARNKCRMELTPNTIRILNEVEQLPESQFEKVDIVFPNNDTCDYEEINSSESSSDISDDHEDNTQKRGNLRLFDNKTNEPISDDSHQAKHSKQNPTNSYVERQSYTYPTSVRNTSGCPPSDDVPGKTVHMTAFLETENEVDYRTAGLTSLSLGSQHTDNEITGEGQSETGKIMAERRNGNHQLTREDQTKSPGKQEKSRTLNCSRAHRVDLKSVHYDPGIKPAQPKKESLDAQHHKKAHPSRSNRVVDMNSVHVQYAPENVDRNKKYNVKAQKSKANRIADVDSLHEEAENQFKSKVNKDEKALERFIGYVKEAWLYCKKKTPRCILL